MVDRKLLENLDPQNQAQMQQVAQVVFEEISSEGKTMAEALHLPEAFLEETYSLGYSCYEQGKYKEAAGLFYVLVTSSPRNYKYVLGLAGAFHQLGEYHEASLGFFMAYTLDNDNPTPLYYAADCLLKLGQPKEAKDFLEEAIEIAGERSEFTSLKERCQLIRKSL